MDNSSTTTTAISTVVAGLSTPGDNLYQGCIVLVITVSIIVSNVVNIVVWSRITWIAPVTKFILLNLSVSDILVGSVACAPAVYSVFTGHWPYGDVWCQISGVVHSVSCAMSVWCISMVGIDRYVAIIWPYRYQQVLSQRNAVIIMTTLWLCALATFIAPIFTKDNFIYYQFTQELKTCGPYWEYPLYCIITTLYIPVASAVVIVFTAVRINRSLNRSHVPRANANRKAVRKLVASAVVFVVCWGPYVNLVSAMSFMPAFRPSPNLQLWTLWLGNCNSFLNVFVYSFIHKSFRQGFVRLVTCRGATVGPELSDPANNVAGADV